MKTILKYSSIIFLWIALSSEIQAQIRFKLSKQGGDKTYVVSLIPDKTYSYPNNIIPDKMAVEWINNMHANYEDQELVILDSTTGIVIKSQKISSNAYNRNRMDLIG